MNDLVCPDCGHGEFHADHSATVRRTYTVSDSGRVSETDEEVRDIDRDIDALTCDCCESEWQEDDLVTVDHYSESE